MKARLGKNIVIVHMRNDLSGSTRVLAHAVSALHEEGYHIHLFYSDAEYPGFLSDLSPDIKTHRIPYRRYGRRWQTFGSYALVQIWLFFALLRFTLKPFKLYVNTVLPFGAAMGCWFMRKPVVYHVHEISLAPAPRFLKKGLFRVLNLTATQVIVVSDYLATQLKLSKLKSTRVYNVLSAKFVEKANDWHSNPIKQDNFSVLMVCSLAKYKGVDRFLKLAKSMEDIHFELVLNATDSEINQILPGRGVPANMMVHSAKRDIHPFYQKSSVLLNLSDADQHIETFGMTVLEGMAYGLPSIVPNVGGVVELVDHQINGYQLDSANLDLIRQTIYSLKENQVLYNQLSAAALGKSKFFNVEMFNKGILKAFEES